MIWIKFPQLWCKLCPYLSSKSHLFPEGHGRKLMITYWAFPSLQVNWENSWFLVMPLRECSHLPGTGQMQEPLSSVVHPTRHLEIKATCNRSNRNWSLCAGLGQHPGLPLTEKWSGQLFSVYTCVKGRLGFLFTLIFTFIGMSVYVHSPYHGTRVDLRGPLSEVCSFLTMQILRVKIRSSGLVASM